MNVLETLKTKRGVMASRKPMVQRVTLLSVLLTVGLVWIAVPAQAQTSKVSSFTKATGVASASGKLDRDIIEKRTINSKTTLLEVLPDGRKRYALDTSAGPIHYKGILNNPDEPWKDIDTTIRATDHADYQFYNRENLFKSYFRKDSRAKDAVKYQAGERFITYTLRDNELGSLQDAVGYPERNMFIYPQAYAGVDVKYSVQSVRLLEEFVFYSYKPVERISQEIFFKGAHFERQDDGSYKFYDAETDEELWTIPQPVMYELDDPTVRSYGLHYELYSHDGNTFTLVKVLDEEGKAWLADEKRNFPVAIDATIDRDIAASSDDAKIDDSAYSHTGTTIQFGGVGTSPLVNFGQGYRFTNITIPQWSNVYSAYLSIVDDAGSYIGIEVRLTAIDQDNTATFSSGSPPGSRPITSSYIAAQTPNVSRSAGERVNYPTTAALQQTLGAAINAVVNRAGWSSGNALAVVNNSDQDSGAVQNFGRATYRTYDYGTPATNGPKLHVEYSEPGEGRTQLIIGGYNDALSNAATEYNAISGGYTWATDANNGKQVVSTPGTLKNLFVKLSAAPGSGTSYTFTVMKNGTATALAVTISDTATTGSNTSDSASVVAGDIIQLRSTYSGSPSTPTARWSVMFEEYYPKQSLILGLGGTTNAATIYHPISHGNPSGSTSDETTQYQIIPTSGYIKNLYVALSADPGTSPDAYRFTLRKNRASTSLTFTITADNTTGNDTVNVVPVAAGDYVDLMVEPLNSPSAQPTAWWGMSFVADTDGESLILGQSYDNPSVGSTEYNHLTTTAEGLAWGATESNFYQGGQVATLKKLYVMVSATLGDGKSYTLKPRVNGVDSGISVTISSYLRVPTGDGDISGTWNTAPLWDDVDETTPNDADYITGTTDTGGYCLFTFTPFNIPAGTPIAGLTTYFRARDVGTAGTNNMRNSIKVNNTYYHTIATSRNPGTSFTTYSYTYTTNPDTGLPWTVDDINGTGAHPLQQFGVYSTDLAPDIDVSMIYAAVNVIGSDTVNTYTLANFDDVNMSCTPSGTPETASVYWGLVCYIQPAPTAVTLSGFTATEYEDGVLVEWKTGYEVNNLGFHIYREQDGQLYRLTPELVAGSALLAGQGTVLGAGHSYFWWDASAIADVQGPLTLKDRPLASRTVPQVTGLEDRKSFASSEALLERSAPQAERSSHGVMSPVRYWLKDIDLSGKDTMHGPVTPVFSQGPVPEKLRPELLSERGMRLQERYEDYWKVQELKEKLALRRLEVRGSLRVRSLRTGPTGLEGRGFHGQPDPPAIAMQQFLASKPAVRLSVREEGWYRVTQLELVAAGLDPRVNPRHLQLYVDGREEPIRVIGGRDGRFGPRDAIEFYGVGLDTPSTDTRVYWLIEGTQPGKRIDNHIFNPPFRNPQSAIRNSFVSFPYTVEKKERRMYISALKNGDEENFFGAVVARVPVDQMLRLSHLDPSPSEEAMLEVSLQGVTNAAHRVKVELNGADVGEVVFEGMVKGVMRWAIPQSGLEEGENLVTLEAQGGEKDVSLVDHIRLTYWHTYTADSNLLQFTAQGGRQLSLDGFSHPNIRVIDITDSRDVIEVIGKLGSQQRGYYAVSFRVPVHGQRTLLAFTEERIKSPKEIVANQPSSWHESGQGYDLVIISYGDFLGSLQPLKRLRESQGLRVALIDVEDLYDEFNFGNKSPKAIKDFLTLAKTHWRKPPRFVLLVGDASFDPRNYYGFGDVDFVPTKLIDTVYMETASDDWFVDLNNDGLPEMAIGRLPVQTAEEASIVVSKIVGYEQATRLSEALLVADMKGEKDLDFEAASEEVRALLPPNINVRMISRNNFASDPRAREEIIRDINQGPLLVNFIGHGTVWGWNGDILSTGDADYLTNGLRLPFFMSMTCLNGWFHDPFLESLAEMLLKAKGGGAVAVWTSSGLTEPDKQTILNKELIRLLFNNKEALTIGEAATRAKASVSDQDVRKTWILFGDPTTKLK